MSFSSFEEALNICMNAEEGGKEQDEALLYCLEYAPDDLKEQLRGILRHSPAGHSHHDDCGCGCHHEE